MQVRRATRDDLNGIGRIADAAHWHGYQGLLTPATISSLIRRDYGPSTLKRRLLRGWLLVAEHAGRVVGFADVEVDEGAIHLRAIAAEPPGAEGSISGALLEAAREEAPDLPVCTDVLLGHLESEHFYEAHGFVPGETFHDVIFEEHVVERRWWLVPA
jgi:N-acetylglutamate synthase-like GNAT family acetyltransferase